MDEPTIPTRLSADQGAELLRMHGSWMRSAALARLREQDAVDEVLQNVALAVVHAGRAGKEIQQSGAWLYRVLLRQCLLFRRRKGRERKWHQRRLEQGPDVAASSSMDPLHWLLASERQSLVRHALQTLPNVEMELLLLKYVERWSCQQIARHLQVTEGAVESRLHRARQRLRTKLEQRMTSDS